jgi:hypothetical protein
MPTFDRMTTFLARKDVEVAPEIHGCENDSTAECRINVAPVGLGVHLDVISLPT